MSTGNGSGLSAGTGGGFNSGPHSGSGSGSGSGAGSGSGTGTTHDLTEQQLVAELIRRKAYQDRRQLDTVTALALANRLDDLSAAVISLQDMAQDRERDVRIELRAMERKVDEGVEIAARSGAGSYERCAGLEGRVREGELAVQGVVAGVRREWGERLSEGMDKVGGWGCVCVCVCVCA